MRRSLTPPPRIVDSPNRANSGSKMCGTPPGRPRFPLTLPPAKVMIFLDQKYHHFGQPASVDVGAGLGRILSPKPLIFHWFFDGFVGRACCRAIFGQEITWPDPRRAVRRGAWADAGGRDFLTKNRHPQPRGLKPQPNQQMPLNRTTPAHLAW